MHRIATCLTALTLVVASTAVAATDDPIGTRKALMDATGAAAGAGGAMLKQEVPFSPAVANSVFMTFRAVGHTFGDYFPEGSFPEGSGTGDTKASPKIWEDPAAFQAAIDKFRTDAEAAVAAKPQDLAAFQAAFGTVTANCKSCHEAFRLP